MLSAGCSRTTAGSKSIGNTRARTADSLPRSVGSRRDSSDRYLGVGKLSITILLIVTARSASIMARTEGESSGGFPVAALGDSVDCLGSGDGFRRIVP